MRARRLLSLLLLAGCGDDAATPIDAATDAPAIDADPDPDRTAALALLGVPCADAPADVYLPRTPPAPWTAADRGTVVACAYDRTLPGAELAAHFTTEGLPPPPGAPVAVHKLRLAYWTERGPGEPVLTSAALYLPTRRRGPTLPLIVAGHGSVGAADACAPSRDDPAGFHRDWRTMLYPLAGDGWIVIAPDYPGLGTPGPTTWQLAADEGHAMLDATRAARHLVRSDLLTAGNALVGHSNGGHAALAAHAYAAAYPPEGTIDTVVVWAPLWISNAAWAALASDTGAALLTPAFAAMMLLYLDAHLEAYDGEAARVATYRPDRAAAVRTWLDGGCWRSLTAMATGASSIGITIGRDAFTDTFVDQVGQCGLVDACSTPLETTWRARFAADRPVPDPTIPIVLWQGARDDFLSPGYQQCGIDRLVAQGAQLTACADVDADHSDIAVRSSAAVRAHLAHVFFGAPAPAACPRFADLQPTPSCSIPIPNGTDPDDP